MNKEGFIKEFGIDLYNQIGCAKKIFNAQWIRIVPERYYEDRRTKPKTQKKQTDSRPNA